MRLLADENIPYPVVRRLRSEGHDACWVGDDNPGVEDRSVFKWAHSEERLLLTFDKDFGALTFRDDAARPAGILLFRLSALSKDDLVDFVVKTIQDRNDWYGHFAVIEQERIRMRPLSPS